MRQVERRSGGGDAASWPAVVSRLLDTASEGWAKLARVCLLLLFLAALVAAWRWLPGFW
jgi:hypothetical protein